MIAYVLFAISVLVTCRGWRRGVRSLGASYRFFLAVFCVGTLSAALTSQTTLRLMQTAPRPWPQLVFLVGAWSSLGAAFCVLSMLSYALADPDTARRRTRRHSIYLVACIAAMGVLLALIAPAPEAMVDFIGVYGHDVRAKVFYGLDSIYILLAVAEFTAVIQRYLYTAQPARQIVISLWWEMAGAGFATLWCLWGFVRTVAGAHHADIAIHGPVITDIFASSSVGVMIVGAVWLVSFKKASDLWSAWATWRLQPLWTELRTIDPTLALDTSGWPAAQVLQRRILEIADWFSRLPMFVHPQLPAWTAEMADRHRLTASDAEAILAAAVIASGIPAHDTGHRYGLPARTIHLVTGPATASMGTRVRALLRIAFLADISPAYQRLTGHRERRLVRDLRDRTSRDSSAPPAQAPFDSLSSLPLIGPESPHYTVY